MAVHAGTCTCLSHGCVSNLSANACTDILHTVCLLDELQRDQSQLPVMVVQDVLRLLDQSLRCLHLAALGIHVPSFPIVALDLQRLGRRAPRQRRTRSDTLRMLCAARQATIGLLRNHRDDLRKSSSFS